MIGNPRTSPQRKLGVSGESGEPPEQPPIESENEDILALLVNEPHVALQSGQILFTEGDPPSCMYVVKSGALRIRSGGVIYEDVGLGGIVGEMALVERYPARSATVYALSDCELVAVDEARFSSLVAGAPHFALRVMQILSRRLRAMDRRYRPEPLVAREPLEP